MYSCILINNYKIVADVYYLVHCRKENERSAVKWVDKISFDRMNKLFVIFANERNHEILLIDQNLLKLVRDSEAYVVPNFPRFAPKVMVPGEHYVVKDLPFYVEARATDAKARAARLAQKEKKRQEGTLKQAPGGSHPATSSTAFPIPKKSTPRPVEKTLDLSPSPSTLSSPSMGDSSSSPSMEDSLDQEPETTMPFINLEPKEEEEAKEMAPKLKVNFKEKHCKRLNKALHVAPPPAKKNYPKAPREEPIPDAPVV